MLHLYRLLRGYGERYARPFLWSTVLLVLSTAAELFLGTHLVSHPPNVASDLTLSRAGDWFRVLQYNLRTMLLLRPTGLDWSDGARFIDTIQSVAGPLLVRLFALALRQRLRR